MSLAEGMNISIPHNLCVSGSLYSFEGGGKYTNNFRTRQNTYAIQKLDLMHHGDPKAHLL